MGKAFEQASWGKLQIFLDKIEKIPEKGLKWGTP